MAIRPSSTAEKQDAAREPASARELAVTSAAASLDAFGCTFILAPAMSVRISAEDALLLSAFAVADLSILVESECQVRGGDWQAVVPKLGPDARRVHAEENAGGASVISEALSMEVLCRLLGARLVCTELELRYFPAAGPITDYALALRGGDVLGVSVTRAFSFGEAALSVPHAAALLSKKLVCSRNQVLTFARHRVNSLLVPSLGGHPALVAHVLQPEPVKADPARLVRRSGGRGSSPLDLRVSL